MRWGIIAALVLWCGVGFAEEPAADALKEADPVQEKIEAATQRYYEAIEKIEKDLCRQIDAMVESYADRGDLEIVLELQNQKKQFLESGYPPAAPVFASNRRRAQIEITKAINRMDRAYSDVVAQLTRKRDFTSATRMRDEWKEILATINPKIGDGFEAIRQAKLQKAGLAERNPEKDPVPQQTEVASTDQTVPDILKAINGGLSNEQQDFVRKLPYLTDGIAKALSRSSDLLFFDNLKTISGRHAEMILDGPESHAFVFENPTDMTDGLVSALEECTPPTIPMNFHCLSIQDSTLTLNQFEKLIKISTPLSPVLHFDFALHTLSSEHIKKLKELRSDRRPVSTSASIGEYLKGFEQFIEIGPHLVFRIISPDQQFTLHATALPRIEELECFLALKNFENVSIDMLPLLKKRSDNGFPTAFVDSVMPKGNMREQLEEYGILFVNGDSGTPPHKILLPLAIKFSERHKSK